MARTPGLFDGLPFKSIRIRPHSDDTPNVRVSGDQMACPSEFFATFKLAQRRVPMPELEIHVCLDSGQPTCLGLQVVSGTGSLTGSVLRELPIGAMVREAVVFASFPYTRDRAEGMGRGFELDGETAFHLADIDAVLESRRATRVRVKARPRERGIPVDDAFLQQVARVYMDALGSGNQPTKCIKEKYTVGRATASRWVRRARDAGHLPPASPGRAG